MSANAHGAHRERPRTKAVTLKMVAERADCSVSLVSAALNNARGTSVVSEKTRAHIRAIAADMGYRPNYWSRSLKTRRSRALGVYVQPKPWSGAAGAYEMAMLRGVEAAAADHAYDIVLLNMSSRHLPAICRERLAESRIDGVLLMHADHAAAWIDELAALDPRVVAVDCCAGNEALSRIAFDDYAAVVLAVEHLAAHGHRRIGFIGRCTERGTFDSPDRETPFRDAVRRLGLDDDPGLVVDRHTVPESIDHNGGYCQREGLVGVRALLTRPRPPTAVLVYNHLAGVYALRGAQRMGLRVPEELSVMCIDHSEVVEYFDPLLTRVDHPLTRMGRAGAEMLIELVERRDAGAQCRVFPPAILPGESVAAPSDPAVWRLRP